MLRTHPWRLFSGPGTGGWPAKSRHWLGRGPVVTGIWIVLHAALSLRWPSLRSISSLGLLAIAYATYRDGIRSGMISGGLAFAYFAIAFSERRLFEYGRPEAERLVSLALAIPGIIGLMHSLRLRLSHSELERSLLREREERQQVEAAQEARFRQVAEDYARELEVKVATRTKELAASMKSLEEVGSAIAHDLRNPVRYISGFTELLHTQESDVLSPASHGYLQRIRDNADRVSQLIEDLGRYTRVPYVPTDDTVIDPVPVIAQIVAGLAPRLEETGGRIHIAGSLPALAATYAVLNDVLENLFGNALRFVRPGVSPEIVISCAETAEGPRLLIEDNGPGIAPEAIPRLFEPFYQFQPEGRYFGSGIGLAIVAKGMRQIGGSAGVTSTLGQGSTFWLQFRRVLPKGA